MTKKELRLSFSHEPYDPGKSFKLKAYDYKNKYEASYNDSIAAIASGEIVENQGSNIEVIFLQYNHIRKTKPAVKRGRKAMGLF